MASFEITGGRRLKGEIVPQGAKNEALQVLCAVLLTQEKVRIEHVPDIRDVNKLIDLLKLLGVSVREDHSSLSLGRDGVYYFTFRLPSALVEQLPEKLAHEALMIAQKVVNEILYTEVAEEVEK